MSNSSGHSFHWLVGATLSSVLASCGPGEPAYRRLNPVNPLPAVPLGVTAEFASLEAAGLKMTPEKVRLGRLLFFDRRLSRDQTVSCATCHRPQFAFSEPTAHSTGVDGKVGTRKAPTVVNTAFPIYPVFFWDGRAGSLQEQAKGPIENPVEMATTHAEVVHRIKKSVGYGELFEEVYKGQPVTIDLLVDAIAAYEATRLSGNSPFDRFKAGQADAISEKARMGWELFQNKAKCNQCHLNWNFTDTKFHNLGVGWNPEKNQWNDVGRVKVTGKEEDTGAFKTPTLRDLLQRSPYMHDGSISSLKEVVELYNRGGNSNPWLSPKITRLDLTAEEVDALVEFLGTLGGEGYADTEPTAFPD